MADDLTFGVGQSSHSNSELYAKDFSSSFQDDYFAEPSGGDSSSFLDTMSGNALHLLDVTDTVGKTVNLFMDLGYNYMLGDAVGKEVNGVRHGIGDTIEKVVEGTGQLAASTVRTAYDLGLGSFGDTVEFIDGRDLEKSGLLPDTDRGIQSLERGAEVAKTIYDHPMILVESSVDPIKKSWNEGNKGYAVGLAVGGIIDTFAGTKGLGNIGKIAEVAETAGKVAKTAGKVAETKIPVKSFIALPTTPKDVVGWIEDASTSDLRKVFDSYGGQKKISDSLVKDGGLHATSKMSTVAKK